MRQPDRGARRRGRVRPAASAALTVWDATQAPLTIKNGLANMLGLPEFKVEVIAPDVGGGFGTKIMMFFAEEVLVPWAAMQLDRPVKWTEDRREHFISANQERGQAHTARVAVDADGHILGIDDAFVHDTGAYTPYGMVVPIITVTQLPGPYKVPELSLRVHRRLHQHAVRQPVSRRRADRTAASSWSG